MLKKMDMKGSFVLAFLVFALSTLIAQPIPDDWYLQASENQFPGIGYEKLKSTSSYQETSGNQVVVAVLDSGVDIDHEDLDDRIWVNQAEIPDNGIDDDNNGYVDDVHGWNFLGGPDGQNVIKETLEVTRLYAKYREYFKGVDPEKLSKKEREKYDVYLETKEVVEEERQKAKRSLAKIEETESMIVSAVNALQEVIGEEVITNEVIASIDAGDSRDLMIGQKILESSFEQFSEPFTLEDIREQVSAEFNAARGAQLDKLEYRYNPEFNSRLIIGDNYADQTERYYGNNMVSGEFDFHGTHVSGIIAAEQNNDIGIDGIAGNARIMVLRVVPDGDEHDKDVANAIRYAVDNGASVINMSFGKGYPWNKRVVDDAVRYAAKRDVLLVHGAGNDSRQIDGMNNYPNDRFEKRCLFGPKNAKNWIEVGALSYQEDENAIASFSNYGKEQVDLFAPGVYIYSTAPNDAYAHANGTSMASPVVAGVAAMIRSHFPALTAKQVREVLLESADPISQKVFKPGTYERVNASELSQTGGIVNAYAAYQLASKTKGKKKLKDTEKTGKSGA